MINVCESLSMSSARLSVGLKQVISPPLAWLSSSLVMLEDACMQKAEGSARELILYTKYIVIRPRIWVRNKISRFLSYSLRFGPTTS